MRIFNNIYIFSISAPKDEPVQIQIDEQTQLTIVCIILMNQSYFKFILRYIMCYISFRKQLRIKC